MRTLGLMTGEDYAAQLRSDDEQFQLLLSDVAVPETWFFRGGQVFAHLARRVADVLRQRKQDQTYRILSVPCSTGEEPYSMAIALVEAGVRPASWEIEGVDVCSRHLEVARGARFGSFSFRQMPAPLQNRYFKAVEGGRELDSVIRSRVRFRPGNLADPLFLGGEGAFDLILCRNLFIYLTPDARRQALNTILRLLAADGWLCTGHADPIDVEHSGFTRTGPGAYFLYRRTAESRQAGKKLQGVNGSRPKAVKRKYTTTKLHSDHRTIARSGHLDARVPSAASAAVADLLVQARQQADRGRLAEALASCQEELTRVGPSADLYSLMGVIYQARQENGEAVRCYQRALYMNREHPEALTHLMLLVQERGDGAQAERLRRRLERVASGGEA
jgi:chemotaxis protein methyltransferase WspC